MAAFLPLPFMRRIARIVEATSFDENNKDEVFRIMLSEKIIGLMDRRSASGKWEALNE